jgi:hypothetical protein
LNKGFSIEKGISDIVGVFTDPIVAYPGAWMDTIPDWLKQRITLDRLVMNMKALRGEKMTGTDSEALAYMMPVTFEFPLDRDWQEIYLYLATKVLSSEGKEVPQDIRHDSLNDYQMGMLNHLKDWIYKKRTDHRFERDRDERRKRREEEAARRKAEQPALFIF